MGHVLRHPALVVQTAAPKDDVIGHKSLCVAIRDTICDTENDGRALETARGTSDRFPVSI